MGENYRAFLKRIAGSEFGELGPSDEIIKSFLKGERFFQIDVDKLEDQNDRKRVQKLATRGMFISFEMSINVSVLIDQWALELFKHHIDTCNMEVWAHLDDILDETLLLWLTRIKEIRQIRLKIITPVDGEIAVSYNHERRTLEWWYDRLPKYRERTNDPSSAIVGLRMVKGLRRHEGLPQKYLHPRSKQAYWLCLTGSDRPGEIVQAIRAADDLQKYGDCLCEIFAFFNDRLT